MEKIVTAFKSNPEYDIIAFRLRQPNKSFPDKSFQVGYFQSGRIGSCQIGFRRTDLVTSIHFCEKMGSGTGNGGGEDNKFIVDCLKRELKIRYVPMLIGSVAQTESKWFDGFNKKYWVNRGWTSKMTYGRFGGIPVYMVHFVNEMPLSRQIKPMVQTCGVVAQVFLIKR